MARQKSLIFPREHGAWGMLLVPLITGAAAGLMAGGRGPALAPLTLVVLALFWLRTPVESWLGAAAVKARTAAEFGLVKRVVLVLAMVSAVSLAWLFWGPRNLGLLWIGAAAGAAFVLQAAVKYGARDRREAAQTIGAAGLTAVAPAAWYVVTGGFGATAWVLWLANLLFAANQIQYVQLRIRAARAGRVGEKLAAGRGFLAGQFVLLAILALACWERVFPWYAAAAFLPVLGRGFAWYLGPAAPLRIHTLGKQELLYAGLFGVILVAGMAC